MNNYQTFYSPTIPNLIQSRANAVSSIPFSQTITFSEIGSPPRSAAVTAVPLVPPRSMADISPTTSSPSLYSRRDHSPRTYMRGGTGMNLVSRRFMIMSDSDLSDGEREAPQGVGRHDSAEEDNEDDDDEEKEDEDEEDDPRKRISMVGGPKVRKFTDTSPWDDEWSNTNGVTDPDSFTNFGFSKHATKMTAAATASATAAGAGAGGKLRSRDPSIASSIITRSESSFDGSNASASASASTSTSVASTRRGLAQILGKSSTSSKTARHLLPSASGLSLASTQTASTTSSDDRAPPLTPKLRQNSYGHGHGHGHGTGPEMGSPTLTFTARHSHAHAQSKSIYKSYTVIEDEVEPPRLLPAVIPVPRIPSVSTYKKPVPVLNDLPLPLPATLNTVTTFAASDRPLLSSGSPGFGLISLEAAQERERQRSQSNSAHLHRHDAHGGRSADQAIGFSGVNASALDAALRKVEATASVSATTTAAATSTSSARPNTTYDLSTIPIPDEPVSTNPLRPTMTNTSAPSSPPQRVRTKKSGLMKLFNKGDKAQTHSNQHAPPIPSTRSGSQDLRGSRTGSMWSDAGGDSIWSKQSNKNGRKIQAAQAAHALIDSTPMPSQPLAKPQLELRPISMTFTRGLPLDYLSQQQQQNQQQLEGNEVASTLSPNTSSRSSTRYATAALPRYLELNDMAENHELNAELASALKDQIHNARKAWRVQLFELEAQIRELRDELEQAKSVRKVTTAGTSCCETCGCACGGTVSKGQLGAEESRRKVIDRARVKTAGARGVFGSGSLYEWE